MATTFVDYTGDGNATKSFSFPSIKEADVKVEVDGVVKTTSTHYNITSYTTTGGGNVVFTSGNIPASPAAIRIFRDTDVDNAKATYTAGSSVKAGDLNNNHEQLLFAAQEEQNQTVTTSKIKDAAVTTAKIKADQITSALIADDQINSEHYVDGSIDTAHIADLQVTTAKIAADAVNGTKIADDSINSEHYVDGSIDTAHIANSQITTDKLNNSAVTTAKITDANITTAKIADSNVTTAKIADANVTTAKITDNAVTMAKLNSGALPTDVTVASANLVDGTIVTADIADNAVTMAKLNSGTLPTDITVASANLVNGTVDTVDLADNAVTTAKITDANITTAKIADNNITVGKIADGELKTLAGMQTTTASNLASGTALTATTAELNQLDGITLETSVTTSSDTRIPTSKAVNDLVLSVTNALGGFVAIANETSFPTANPDPSNGAGTVVSISQLASGLAVNGSGVATISNGAGSGNTVTINGFPSSLVSQTLPATSGLQVQTTTTLHTYTFHKQLASAADIQAISATVNSFSNRYRVSASAPTSSLDGGDLWYDTTNSKLMVYSSQNSAWEESSAIGNFFICTLSSSSSTGGGSATANGTAYRFTISNAPQSAQSLIVSVDGVVQKPNAGSSQPSEGFVLVGNDIIFGAAPVNGASIFVTAIGSTVGIGTPSDNTVTTAILQNGSVTTAKITDANVTTAKIADDAVTTAKIVDANVTTAKITDDAVTADKIANSVNSAIAANTAKTTNATHTGDVTGGTSLTIASGAVTTAKIADDAVTAAKLANTAVTAASYGSASAIPVITVDAQGRITAASTAATTSDLVGDTSPQLGGDLDTNSHEILLDDNHKIKFGDGNDLTIESDGTNGLIKNHVGGGIFLRANTDIQLKTNASDGGADDAIKCVNNGAVELYNNGSKRLQTEAWGTRILATGQDTNLQVQGESNRSAEVRLIADAGAQNSDYSRIHKNKDTGKTHIQNYASASWEDNIVCENEGAVELYHDNTKTLETINNGIKIHGGTGEPSLLGTLTITGGTTSDDHQGIAIMPGDSNSQAHIRFGYGSTLKWQWRVPFHTDGASAGMQLYSWDVGTDIFKWDNSGEAHARGIRPFTNNTYDLGTSSYRWRNIYTNDLNLSNEGSSNDVDGTWGNWTIQEGESDLFLKNNRSGKKYKFNLTEGA